MSASEILVKITENAEGPKQVLADGVNVTQHSLREQIEAHKYVAGQEASVDFRKSFSRVKIVSPGTV